MAPPRIEDPVENAVRTGRPRPPAGPAVWVFAVLLLTFAAYAPSVGNDFTWDDRPAAMGQNSVVRNPLVAELHPLQDYFTSTYWPTHAPAGRAYRPVTVLSFALRHAAVGDNAQVAHLINVLLHVLAVALCILLLRTLGISPAASCVGALVFGAHAIHSEAVANVVGRAEVLAFCFGTGGLLLLDRARRRSAWLYPAAAALFFLAYHAKESALAWAVFAPLTLALHQPRWTTRRVVAVTLTVALPALLFLVLRAQALADLPAVHDDAVGFLENPLLGTPFLTRLCTGTLAWGYGLLLTLLPFSLTADYGPHNIPIVHGLGEPWIAGSLLAASALGGALIWSVLWLRRGQVLPLLAVACFGGFSFLVTNIPVPVFMLFAERTWYTPSLAMAMLVAWWADRMRRAGGPHPGWTLLLGAWLGASALVVLERNRVWRDDQTLILAEVQTNPGSVRMQLCAGDLYAGQGDLETARAHFRAAARLDPWAPQPWLELARLELGAGRLVAAREALDQAMQGRADEVAHWNAALRDLLARLKARAAAPR